MTAQTVPISLAELTRLVEAQPHSAAGIIAAAIETIRRAPFTVRMDYLAELDLTLAALGLVADDCEVKI